jgi:hypothetical protein
MREIIVSMAAKAERPEGSGAPRDRESGSEEHDATYGAEDAFVRPLDPAACFESLVVHSFPVPLASGFTTEVTEDHGGDQNSHPFDKLRAGSVAEDATRVGHRLDDLTTELEPWEARELERERRVYRRRTVAMLRRYLRFSIETGRLPSVLGREFFRAKVTSYGVGTFEDRVIFVHDMETCLERLDEFSRQLIARHILQEHDQEATARLLHCTDRTVRTYVPIVLDMLSEILLDLGLMERLDWGTENRCAKPCQGGEEGENLVSDCEESENKF